MRTVQWHFEWVELMPRGKHSGRRRLPQLAVVVGAIVAVAALSTPRQTTAMSTASVAGHLPIGTYTYVVNGRVATVSYIDDWNWVKRDGPVISVLTRGRWYDIWLDDRQILHDSRESPRSLVPEHLGLDSVFLSAVATLDSSGGSQPFAPSPAALGFTATTVQVGRVAVDAPGAAPVREYVYVETSEGAIEFTLRDFSPNVEMDSEETVTSYLNDGYELVDVSAALTPPVGPGEPSLVGQ